MAIDHDLAWCLGKTILMALGDEFVTDALRSNTPCQ